MKITIQRYDLDHFSCENATMMPNRIGLWVKYEDVKELVEKRNELQARYDALERLIR